jgi:hypothetical protein
MFGDVALPPEVLAVYARQITEPGAATAMLNWYRAIRLAELANAEPGTGD